MILKSTAVLSVKGFNSLEDAINFHEAEELPVEKYIHHFRLLPDHFNKQYKFGSFLKVNLFDYTCNCATYIMREEEYDGRDIRKACKHIYRAINLYAWKEVGELTTKILRNQMKSGPEKLFKFDDDTLFATRPRTEWIRIYSLVEGRWIQYYYSKKQKRFSHRYKPKNWEEIELIINGSEK